MKILFSGNSKKITTICFFLAYLSTICFAEIISFGTHFRNLQNSFETMDVTFSVPDGFDLIAVPQKGTELNIKFAIRPKPKPSSITSTKPLKSRASLSDEHTEVRHCIFLDTGTTEQSFNREFIIFMLNCTSLIAGRELILADFAPVAKTEVNKICKADIGYICYVTNPHSRFTNGYSQMMIEFYGKQGVGIVLRATVSNTTKALTSKTGAFTKAKTSFSF